MVLNNPNVTAAGTAGKPRMKLIAWKPMVKNTLRGFASIELPNGLRIFEITVHEKGDRRWASMPGRPQMQDGRHRIGEDGKPAWAPMMEWATRELRDQFSARIVELVLERSPELFDVGSSKLF